MSDLVGNPEDRYSQNEAHISGVRCRGSYTTGHFIWNLLSEPLASLYEMHTIVRFCLSCDLSNAILSPSRFVYFKDKLHCWHGRRYDVTCSCRKCHDNVIHDMSLTTE